MKYVALAFVLSLVILQISAQVGAAYIPGMGLGSVGRTGAVAGASAGVGNQGNSLGYHRRRPGPFQQIIHLLQQLVKQTTQQQRRAPRRDPVMDLYAIESIF